MAHRAALDISTAMRGMLHRPAPGGPVVWRPFQPEAATRTMNFADAYLLYAIAAFAMVLAGLGAWLAERVAGPPRRREPPSPVWVFNNMPAASRVDTEVSARAAAARTRRMA